MPGKLGSLVVSLGIDAAEFTAGLTRSQVQAASFANRLRRDVNGAIKDTTVALGILSATGGAAFAFLAHEADEIGHFRQISEQIGDTSDAVAALATAAATSNVSLDSVSSASVKLSVNLAKTDDEGSNAAKALKALGINLAEFKALSPVGELEATAAALARFQDGAGKTAAAVALFGREGAQLLPFLNDLADQGGRNARLTREQVDAADAFTKQIARLREESALAAQSIASALIPSVSDLLTQLTEGKQIAGGFVNALTTFGSINPFRSLAGNIAEARDEIDKLLATKATKSPLLDSMDSALGFGIDKLIANARARLAFLELQQRQAANRLISPSNNDARDFLAQQKPRLTVDLSTPKVGGDVITAAQRYEESLQRQLESVQELSASERALQEIQSGRLGNVTAAERAAILAVAGEVDSYRDLQRWLKDSSAAFDEQVRARERAEEAAHANASAAFDEAASIVRGNQDLRDQIEIITGGEEARRRLEEQHLSMAIAMKEFALAELQASGASQELVTAMEAQIQALQTRANLLQSRDLAADLKKQADDLQKLKGVFTDDFADAFTEFIDGSKNARDSFKDLVDSLTRDLARLAAQDLFGTLFGTKQPGDFSFGGAIGSLLGALFGGGGVPGNASGTDFWRGGRTWVGENGPEIVNLPRGAQVVPSDVSQRMAGGDTYNISMPIMPGASRQTADQAAAAVVKRLKRAQRVI